MTSLISVEIPIQYDFLVPVSCTKYPLSELFSLIIYNILSRNGKNSIQMVQRESFYRCRVLWAVIAGVNIFTFCVYNHVNK